MTDMPQLSAAALDLDAIATFTGRVVVFVGEDGKLDQAARRVNRLTKGALERCVAGDAFSKLKPGDSVSLAYPTGVAATGVQVIRLERRPSVAQARKAGGAIGKGLGKGGALVLAGTLNHAAEVALGAALRAYRYSEMRSEEAPEQGDITCMVSKPDDLTAALSGIEALAGGVYFTRDLVNKPANVLTTQTFADLLEANAKLGLKVEVLEEPDLEKLGMNLLLGVGVGSETPTKVVVMEWNGGGDEPPLALIGKGVVFDTGGISLKPGAGMEDMTMDMGGAGVVSGVMQALAARKAKANVVGLVGLVENMPDGRAQRPGDVVTSMKGDTVEVINTDAEGRLVLADVMWYAADRFKPVGMIDLATLTGAIIVALGHENAGVFSNDDAFCAAFLKAAEAEDEGAWRMPLGEGYKKLLKSDIADVKNIGGRWGGSVTAAEFLHRFVPEDMPWIHLDIAGVAKPLGETTLAPKGATGWGVLALDRMIRDTYEG
ncbi:leucyl aminopeptidase [Actibacterium sp. 188UL27-1]|uniref:leucyl aminopeptidase n=1 Tax=Actibacterium sp. 188UL27-1 TaxID=2786961 RepID=UPI001957F6C6|nr:leucyl aminopeptidase [Actibacterium sp. 188UL27-1]MBM7067489.1 leucyl aminopeptidase [Actibacterium sp. 188UL27-1]